MSAKLRLPQRQRTIGRSVIAGLVAASLATAGIAAALWNSTATSRNITVGRGAVAFSLAFAASDRHQEQFATGSDSVLKIDLGEPEAIAAMDIAGDGLALPFTVRLESRGSSGLDYTIAVPTLAEGSILAGADLRVFPVADAADCVVAKAPKAGPNLTGISGINPGRVSVGTVVEHIWCLTAKYNPANAGQYANTATLTIEDSHGTQVQFDSNTWNARVLPNPHNETPVPDGQYENTATLVIGDSHGAEVQSDSNTWEALVLSDPQANAGQYENIATVTAKDLNGTDVQSDDSWYARILADPAEDLTVELKLSHTITRP